jgi:hypothetical protein
VFLNRSVGNATAEDLEVIATEFDARDVRIRRLLAPSSSVLSGFVRPNTRSCSRTES